MTKGRKKIIIDGWMDYDKSIKHILEDSFTYSRPTTKHTNPDIVSKKVRLTIEEIKEGK